MAVTRTILSRKGLIQSQHGLTGYEADQDANWALLDANVAFLSDLQQGSFDLNGVLSGFALSVGTGLTPAVAVGVLFAQGERYAPATPPNLAAAPASQTSYLFYNASAGFYYQSSPVGANAGDALIGVIVTGSSAVTSVTNATKIYGQVDIPSTAAPGNLTVPHLLGRAPVGAAIQMTSDGSIYWQSAMWDGTNLYLVSSDTGLTAKVQIW